MYRPLLAVPVAALLTVGAWTGTALAQADPSADCQAKQSHLAALQSDLAAAIAADNEAGAETDSQAVITLKTQVQVQTDLVEEACTPAGDPEDEPTDDPAADPTTEDPATTETPAPVLPFADCAEARAAGAAPISSDDPRYSPNLDRDNDGLGCEAGDTGTSSPSGNESLTGDDDLGGDTDDGNSGVVDSVPSGSVDTGWVA